MGLLNSGFCRSPSRLLRRRLADSARSANQCHDGPSPRADKVLIVDFGSQVTQLIARRVREAGVYSEIVPFDKAEAALKAVLPKAIILSGGPASRA